MSRSLLTLAALLVALVALSACAERSDTLSSQEVLERASNIDVELPPGRKLDLPAIRDDMRYGERVPEALVHDVAMCLWMEYWLERFEASDMDGAEAAIKGVSSVAQMEIYSYHDQSYRDYIEAVVDYARDGDSSEVVLFLQSNC